MTTTPQNATWEDVRKAGGREKFVLQTLAKEGLEVEPKDASSLSKKALADYKRALKAEAARRKELMRQSWQLYKASHIVHLGEHVFWNDDWDWDKHDHPRAKERVQELDLFPLDSPAALAHALDLTIPQLRWLTTHREAATDLHYTRFFIPKRSGGQRAIWAPRPLLKRTQHWVLRQIAERLPVHGSAHGFVPGRSIYTNALPHTDSEVLLKVDLKDFFPTVTLPRVKGLFRHAGYREQLATLLALLCTEAPREVVEFDGTTYFVALGPRALPQGAPTSPALTNALCMSLDRRLTGLAQSLGWRYTRYADDLTFSLPRGADPASLGKVLGGLKMIVAAEGFLLHPDKTRILRPSACQQVTGLVVNGPGTPRVPRTTKRMLRAALHNLEHGKPLRDAESLYTFLGWSAFVYMTDKDLGKAYIQQVKGLIA